MWFGDACLIGFSIDTCDVFFGGDTPMNILGAYLLPLFDAGEQPFGARPLVGNVISCRHEIAFRLLRVDHQILGAGHHKYIFLGILG